MEFLVLLVVAFLIVTIAHFIFTSLKLAKEVSELKKELRYALASLENANQVFIDLKVHDAGDLTEIIDWIYETRNKYKIYRRD